jgi:hypothetical protein
LHDRADATRGTAHSLAELRVTTAPLAELSEHSWPFVRDGYFRLIRPSTAAKEAVHPVPLPEPKLGRGLPRSQSLYRSVRRTKAGYLAVLGDDTYSAAFRTEDHGLTFRPTSSRSSEASELSGRCPLDEEGRAFVLGKLDDNSTNAVLSIGPDGAPYSTAVGPRDAQVFAASCDAEALVTALHAAPGGPVEFAVCSYRRPCRRLEVPHDNVPFPLVYPLDVARIHGTTVLAVVRSGIVRVASSRDEGRSWTPFVVAYDAAEYPVLGTTAPPSLLLPVGQKLWLYGGATKGSDKYLALVSFDFGASFRAP